MGCEVGDMLCGRIASGRELDAAGMDPEDEGRAMRAAGFDESRSTRGGCDE